MEPDALLETSDSFFDSFMALYELFILDFCPPFDDVEPDLPYLISVLDSIIICEAKSSGLNREFGFFSFSFIISSILFK